MGGLIGAQGLNQGFAVWLFSSSIVVKIEGVGIGVVLAGLLQFPMQWHQIQPSMIACIE